MKKVVLMIIPALICGAVFLISQSAKGFNDTSFTGEYSVSDEIIVPNAFRPNSTRKPGDNVIPKAGNRDSSLFFPTVLNPTKSYKMVVMNRSGKMMFETIDRNRGWNGFVEGNLAPVGSYFYVINGIFENGNSFSKNGAVRLLKPKQ